MDFYEQTVRIHISCGSDDSNLHLKELINTLSDINLSLNNVYRSYGVSNYNISDYSAEIDSVENGSIIINLLICKLVDMVLEEFIKKVFKELVKIIKSKTKKKKELPSEESKPLYEVIVAEESNIITIKDKQGRTKTISIDELFKE